MHKRLFLMENSSPDKMFFILRKIFLELFIERVFGKPKMALLQKALFGTFIFKSL